MKPSDIGSYEVGLMTSLLKRRLGPDAQKFALWTLYNPTKRTVMVCMQTATNSRTDSISEAELEFISPDIQRYLWSAVLRMAAALYPRQCAELLAESAAAGTFEPLRLQTLDENGEPEAFLRPIRFD